MDPLRCDAGGTRLRLQALAVMGHAPTRAARAAGLNPTLVREVAAGRVPEVRRQVCQAVYGEWRDKTPPGDTAAQRAVAGIRHRAGRERWVAPAGLDDDRPGQSGYRPAPRRWLEAEGTGPAPEVREMEREAGRAAQPLQTGIGSAAPTPAPLARTARCTPAATPGGT